MIKDTSKGLGRNRGRGPMKDKGGNMQMPLNQSTKEESKQEVNNK